MIMVHTMADAVLGKSDEPLAISDRELKEQNEQIKKMFLKGTFPEVANMTHYYNVWTGYYNCKNINARIARDINLIQTTNTFFTHFSNDPDSFSLELVKEWLENNNRLTTNIGYDLFDRIILHNSTYRKIVDYKFTTASSNS